MKEDITSVIQDNLFNAMTQIAKSENEKLSITNIIEAKVISKNKNASKDGPYLLEYQMSKFEAYSINPNIEYKANQKVYVMVMNGDMSSEKLIISKKHV